MPKKNSTYDVIVVGGGPAGLMAAGRAAENGKRVLLLEKNNKLGEKLKLTGAGHCNITHAEDDIHLLLAEYGSAAKFLYSCFAQFGVADTFNFFQSRDLPLIIKENKRAFPKTENAADVFKVLEKYLKAGGVEVLINSTVEKIIFKAGTIKGVVVGNKSFFASSYVLATGGKSHPETGSTGDGFVWLKQVGHKIQNPTPTIVPLAVSDGWVKQLAGITLPNIKITFFVNDTKKLALKGDILLTHFGLSGPLILNAAKKVADLLRVGQVTAKIDLFPEFDLGGLDKYITKIFDNNKNKELKNTFKLLTPKGAADIILHLLKINPETKIHSITRDQRKIIGQMLKTLPIKIVGLMGFDRSVVSDGGVALDEIDLKTMRSKLCNNLYLIGDLLNINRPSGGYSLQLCWTTGFVAGNSV